MKIVIIEDHLMFRDVVRRVCVQAGHEVIGESETGASGIELSLRLRPDLLILDLGLPDMDGIVAAKRVRAVQPAIRVLVLSCQLNHYTVLHVERAGFHGFIDKATNNIEAIGAALKAMEERKTYFSVEFQKAQRDRRVNSGSLERILSDAELRVLTLVGEGLSDREIGSQMDIAPTTAQTHRSRILKKLGIKGTPKLIVFAQRIGFVRMSSRSPLHMPS